MEYSKIERKCPAKINLFLKILGKREDNYHNLYSLMAFIDLYDELSVAKSDNFSLKINGQFSNEVDEKNNLLTQILDFFVKEFKISNNLEIKLQKNIPVGAGLGGGSSNARCFIDAINIIFNLKLNKEDLIKISLKFGSDIPFFFSDQASIIKGRGEIIEKFPYFEDLPILLINPKINLSTAKIFNLTKQDNSSDENALKSIIANKEFYQIIKQIENDLTLPAISICPEIKEIIEELKNLKPLVARMSGSGSTCFAIFKNEEELKKSYDYFYKKFNDYFVIQTRMRYKNHSR